MGIEYIVTYKKKAWPDSPHAGIHFATPYLEHALKRYNGMLEWNKRVPAIELKDLRIVKRTYSDEDLTDSI